jgi:hypothetical protein
MINIQRHFSAYFPFLREKSRLLSSRAVCVHASLLTLLQIFNQLTNFHEIWYRHYAIRGHTNLVLSDILQHGDARTCEV